MITTKYYYTKCYYYYCCYYCCYYDDDDTTTTTATTTDYDCDYNCDYDDCDYDDYNYDYDYKIMYTTTTKYYLLLLLLLLYYYYYNYYNYRYNRYNYKSNYNYNYIVLRYATLHYYNYNCNYNYNYSYITVRYTTLINYIRYTLHQTTLHYTTLHYSKQHNSTLHYTTLHYTKYTTPQLQLQLQLQLHWLRYTTTTAPARYTTTTTTTALHHTASSSCGWGDRCNHCNHCNHSKKHNSNYLRSIRDSLCHPCVTTTHLSYRAYFWNFRRRLVRYYWYIQSLVLRGLNVFSWRAYRFSLNWSYNKMAIQQREDEILMRFWVFKVFPAFCQTNTRPSYSRCHVLGTMVNVGVTTPNLRKTSHFLPPQRLNFCGNKHRLAAPVCAQDPKPAASQGEPTPNQEQHWNLEQGGTLYPPVI